MPRNGQPEPPAQPAPAPPAQPIDQDALELKELARAVLARSIRPRVSSVRRLAEAVLAKGKGGKGSGKGSGKGGGKKKARKSRKLATIPGQKARKNPEA